MENVDLESENRSELDFDNIGGESEARRRVITEGVTVAPTDSTVPICGANGAGKDALCLRSLHRRPTISKNPLPHSRLVHGKQQPRHTRKKESTPMTRMSETTRTDAIPHLEIGSQLFHNGVPVQLLYRIGREKQHETWRVRPMLRGGSRSERAVFPDPIPSRSCTPCGRLVGTGPRNDRRTSTKLSREFTDEQQARARERALQVMGYPAWLNGECDGTWQVFWLVQLN